MRVRGRGGGMERRSMWSGGIRGCGNGRGGGVGGQQLRRGVVEGL